MILLAQVRMPCPQNPEMRLVYACRSFESRRHKISHTDMYFAKIEHTLWALEDPLTKIEVILVSSTGDIYRQAVGNSNIQDTQPDIKYYYEAHKHLFTPVTTS